MDSNQNNAFLETNIDYVIEVERLIISAILQNEQNYDEIFLHLLPSDFYEIENRIIFKAALMFHENNKSIDLYAMIDHIKNTEADLDFAHYEDYLKNIISMYSFQQFNAEYIEIIKNASIKRKIVDFSNILKNTDLNLIDAQEKLWELEKEFANIASSKKVQEIEAISKIIDEFNQKLALRSDKNEGISSGFENIDYLTNGFKAGELVILAARPGVGKTTLSINFLINVAKQLLIANRENESLKNDFKQQVVVFFSIEMGKDQICQKMLSAVCNVNTNKKILSQKEKQTLSYGCAQLKQMPIYIDDSSDLTLISIQTKLKQICNTKEVKLIVIDYLQLLKLNNNVGLKINRQQEVAEISRTLKKLARQFEVPIISIAQLSRKIEERRGGPNARPMLSDLRESGSIEQDADMVCFINVSATDENNFDPLSNPDATQRNTLAELEFILAKNRNGATGSCFLAFDKENSVFFEKKKIQNY
ncbi:MAG: replicative DNA helicase [Malacoplasma sp.]|mgnify:CR=1 FL=1|nr:replicative DNA helicase [Malacoplasma sp.]